MTTSHNNTSHSLSVNAALSKSSPQTAERRKHRFLKALWWRDVRCSQAAPTTQTLKQRREFNFLQTASSRISWEEIKTIRKLGGVWSLCGSFRCSERRDKDSGLKMSKMHLECETTSKRTKRARNRFKSQLYVFLLVSI